MAFGDDRTKTAGTSTFTDTDGVQLTTHDSNWTLAQGDFDIQTNSLASDGSGVAAAAYDGVSFNSEQYAKATCVAVLNLSYNGVAVHVSNTSADCYGYRVTNTGAFLFKLVAGGYTQLGATQSGLSVSDTVEIEVVNPGTQAVRAGRNGSQDLSIADSAHSSGYAGVSGGYDNSSNRIDDWEGGDIGAAVGGLSIPVAYHQYSKNIGP